MDSNTDAEKPEIELSPDNDHALSSKQRDALLAERPDWEIIERNQVEYLQRIFTFDSYNKALDFTYRLGILSEKAGRYPALITTMQKVTVMWHTQKAQTLTANDVALAERTDNLLSQI